MLKGKMILGMMVFDSLKGKNLGRIRDIIFDPGSKEALSVIIPGKSIFHVQQWIDFKCIQRDGQDLFMVQPGTKTPNIREVRGSKELLQLSFKNLKGIEVVTSLGRLVGILEDIYLRIPGGQLAGIEVSLGFIDDFLSGRKFLSSDTVKCFGKDSVVVTEGKFN